MEAKLFVLLALLIARKVESSFFEVRYPSVVVSAETGGNLSIVAGPDGGNIYMVPGDRGTVYIGRTDMLKLVEIVNSMPPIWGQKAPFGRLGMFLGGDTINVQLSAIDPEGSALTFEKVSGAMPPGVVLDKDTGLLHGTAPDVDATYEFGVRVTDEQKKYADQTFTIDTREKNQCNMNPCKNGGVCVDDFASFSCRCPVAFGGNFCDKVCANEALGVDANVKNISDAQIAGHSAYDISDHMASDGRLNSATGWIGEGSSSWLQIDLGAVRGVHAVATQGYSSIFDLSTYTLDCSIDGNNFTYVTDVNGTALILDGGGSSFTSVFKQELPVPTDCRYLRFIPASWTGSHPGLRVEVYGCQNLVSTP